MWRVNNYNQFKLKFKFKLRDVDILCTNHEILFMAQFLKKLDSRVCVLIAKMKTINHNQTVKVHEMLRLRPTSESNGERTAR